MNLWRRGPISKNPYARTAFRVAKVPRDVVRHRTLVQIIGQTKRIVSTDPQAHTIQGEPVGHAEINAAEKILLDPKQRVLEELLEHPAEKPPLDRVRQLSREAAQLMSAQAEGPLRTTNLAGLKSWPLSVVRQYLQSIPSSDPSFGALELELVPPFGRPDKE